MFVANGSIADLDFWFHGPDNTKYDFMCLLVAGGYNDDQLISEIIKKGPTFHTITGENTVFFLFAKKENAVMLPKHDYGIIIPGQLINTGWSSECISDVINYDVDGSYREQIKTQSITIAQDICKFYNIQVRNIPCILLVAKESPVPFLVSTKDWPGAEKLYEFFKDLQILYGEMQGIVGDSDHDKAEILYQKIDQLCIKYESNINRHSLPRMKRAVIEFICIAKPLFDMYMSLRKK